MESQEFYTHQAIMRCPNHPVRILGQKWLGRGWNFILADGNEVNLHPAHSVSEDHCNFKTENNNKNTMDGLNSRTEMADKRISELEHRIMVIMLSKKHREKSTQKKLMN